MSDQLDLLTGEVEGYWVNALMRRGPWDGRRVRVPARPQEPTEAQPAFIRMWDDGGRLWWYVWRAGTKATYELLNGQDDEAH